MLESLDTVIAFVLIMLVVSLLITIVVQIAATVLNLRGWNLLVGLKNTFAVIAPDAQNKALSRYAVVSRNKDKQRKELARYLLKGGLLSDSILPWWLTFWRHASAIRPSELFDAIHRIAIGKEPAPENLKDNAQQLLVALGADPQTIQDAQTKITDAKAEADKLKAEATNVQNQLANVVATLPKEVRAGAENVMDNTIRMFGDAATTVGSKLTAAGMAAASTAMAAAGDIDSAYQKFEYWTCICEERAQQWVTMHTRILTVIFAFIFAFVLQLDTVEIFKLVSSNKAVRDKLVAQATAVSSEAEKILGNSPTILQTAYDNWLPSIKDTTVKSALTSFSPAPVKIVTTDTRESVGRQIEDALAKLDNKTKEDALKSFNDAVDRTVIEHLKGKSRDYAKVQADFLAGGNKYDWPAMLGLSFDFDLGVYSTCHFSSREFFCLVTKGFHRGRRFHFARARFPVTD